MATTTQTIEQLSALAESAEARAAIFAEDHGTHSADARAERAVARTYRQRAAELATLRQRAEARERLHCLPTQGAALADRIATRSRALAAWDRIGYR
jgi:hypothetical protein